MPKLNVVAGIIDKVAGHVDKFTLDKQEKAELIAEINKAQMEVNKVEAGHTSIFVAGWRPFTGWICATALGYHFLLQPLLTFIMYYTSMFFNKLNCFIISLSFSFFIILFLNQL